MRCVMTGEVLPYGGNGWLIDVDVYECRKCRSLVAMGFGSPRFDEKEKPGGFFKGVTDT